MLTKQEREFIIKLHEDGKKQQRIAQLIGCSQAAVSKWISKYRAGRTLETLPRSGRPTPLTKETLAKLKGEFAQKARAANKKFCSIGTKKFSELIEQKTGKKYTQRHVERIMHKLDFSRITPRSQHIKNDPVKVTAFRDEFKKNLKQNTWVMRL